MTPATGSGTRWRKGQETMAMAKKRHPRKNTGNAGPLGRRPAQPGQPGQLVAGEAPAGAVRDVTGKAMLSLALRHLGDDDQVPLIITARGEDEPPEGAGELLGELNRDIATDSGFSMPAGSKVWLDTRPGTLEERGGGQGYLDTASITRQPRARAPVIATEVPAAFLRPAAAARLIGSPDRFAAALEGEQPGLTRRLADGLTADELADPGTLQAIARAASAGGAGQYSV